VEKAIEILRLQQGKKIQDLGERTATEGTVQAYIHPGARVGVLIEVDSNTDFVANNEEVVGFARDVAMQIAASPSVRYVSRDDVPADAREAEERIYQQEAADKPENVRERIVAGKLDAWYETVVLAEQEMHHPKFEGKTVQQLRDELTAATGENIVIRRFARFGVGQ
jgi:elongation factor Ts